MRAPILFLLAVVLCMGQVCTPQQGSDGTTGATDLVNGDATTDGGGTTTDGMQDGTTDSSGTSSQGAIIADHLAAAAFDSIPATTIQTVQSNYRIWYGHTSHGGQIMTGLQMIQSLNSSFAVNAGAGSLIIQDDDGVDLGHEGDLGWVTITRDLLNQPGNTINMIMWSWCDGVIDNTESGINTYLNAMNQLEGRLPRRDIRLHDWPSERPGAERKRVCPQQPDPSLLPGQQQDPLRFRGHRKLRPGWKLLS